MSGYHSRHGSSSRRATGNPGGQHKIFHEVEIIERALKNMTKSIGEIEQLKLRSLQSATAGEEKRYNGEIQNICQSTNDVANMIRGKLNIIKTSLDPSDPEYQLNKNQFSNLSRKFMDVLSRYQRVQVSFQKGQQDKLQRQYRIVNPNATQEEMKDAISENNQGSVFQSKLAYKSTEAKRILSEVEERHQNVVRMAQSIQELQQLFLDMQSMVQAQDSLVIQVSDSMSRAKDNTEQATKEMAQAVTNKKASRKKMCILIWCVVLLLVVVGVVVFVEFGLPAINAQNRTR